MLLRRGRSFCRTLWVSRCSLHRIPELKKAALLAASKGFERLPSAQGSREPPGGPATLETGSPQPTSGAVDRSSGDPSRRSENLLQRAGSRVKGREGCREEELQPPISGLRGHAAKAPDVTQPDRCRPGGRWAPFTSAAPAQGIPAQRGFWSARYRRTKWESRWHKHAVWHCPRRSELATRTAEETGRVARPSPAERTGCAPSGPGKRCFSRACFLWAALSKPPLSLGQGPRTPQSSAASTTHLTLAATRSFQG